MEHPSSKIFHAWFPRSSRTKAEKSCSSSTDSKMMGIEFVSPLNPKGFYRIIQDPKETKQKKFCVKSYYDHL